MGPINFRPGLAKPATSAQLAAAARPMDRYQPGNDQSFKQKAQWVAEVAGYGCAYGMGFGGLAGVVFGVIAEPLCPIRPAALAGMAIGGVFGVTLALRHEFGGKDKQD